MDWFTGVIASVMFVIFVISAMGTASRWKQEDIVRDCQIIGKTVLADGTVLVCSIELEGDSNAA